METINPRFDKGITEFAEEKSQRDGIQVNGGLVNWYWNLSSYYGFHEANRTGKIRVMVTDLWLRVEGLPNVYALGDCVTIYQCRVMVDISAIFSKADKNNTRKQINDTIEMYEAKGSSSKMGDTNACQSYKSFKAPNQEFDHTQWLFETNGTYGFGNVVWLREGCLCCGQDEAPPSVNNRMNRSLSRKVGIFAAILSRYRNTDTIGTAEGYSDIFKSDLPAMIAYISVTNAGYGPITLRQRLYQVLKWVRFALYLE
ncbi:Cellulose synthase [Artemisia annua]|uniref:Cellulose synthase n=1 Tax=Artemisia annua TaxID=35608 RepID=A0A2U1NUM9_ARTAN|nr:Cellulose synthase [Artemisia annua]